MMFVSLQGLNVSLINIISDFICFNHSLMHLYYLFNYSVQFYFAISSLLTIFCDLAGRFPLFTYTSLALKVHEITQA